MSKDAFVPLGKAKAQYEKQKEADKEKYLKENRLKEGEGLEGRIIKLADEVSRNGNPMYVATIKCDGNLGKKIDIKTNFVKSNTYAMDQFHSLVALAGFDLDAIDTPEKFDLMIDAFEGSLPNIKFNCKHQDAPSPYNNYEITWCENIAPKSLAAEVKAEEPAQEEAKEEEEKLLGAKKNVVEEYTAADVNGFDKDECIDVAEELGIEFSPKTKTKTAMRKEIIAFLEKGEKAPAEAEEGEENPFPDED